MLYANDERDHDRDQERDHDHERDLIAAVAEALGERRSLIRRHGFQMIEIVVYDDPSNLASDRSQDNEREEYKDEYRDATEDNSDNSDVSTRSIWLVSAAWIGIASTIHGAAVGGTTAVSPS